MICQNSEQTKLSSLKIIYDKGTEAQGVLALLVPVGLWYYRSRFFLRFASVRFAQYQGQHIEEVLVKALADQNEQLGYEHGLFRELGKPKQILHVRILLDSLESRFFKTMRRMGHLNPISWQCKQGTLHLHTIIGQQCKLSLDEYRATFLQVPRIVNRRPVFVSEEVRQKLDQIVLRLSETRRMSVTGLLENICRHHIAMYEDDIEQWRKL